MLFVSIGPKVNIPEICLLNSLLGLQEEGSKGMEKERKRHESLQTRVGCKYWRGGTAKRDD
jgi:hypothetical protein